MANLTDCQIIELIKKEVVPALGCTEPIAVAFASAKASKILNKEIEKIEICVSGNIFKNAMGVGIPGTGMTGLPIAAALGAIGGKADKELEVLSQVTDEDRQKAKEMVAEKRVCVKIKEDTEKLYIEVTCRNKDDYAKVIICQDHTNIIKIEHNGNVLLEKDLIKTCENEPEEKSQLTVKSIYEFATTIPFKEIEFILEGAKMNRIIATEGLKNIYGLQVGKKIQENVGKGIFSDNIVSLATSLTAAASDARMDGCELPVMSNSGSGNQGLAVTLPVVAVAEKLKSDNEKFARALIISNLIAIHIKKHLGRLSALCGCVVAATGSSCGIVHLMDGGYEEITHAVKNMVGTITGMICDGAKPGCALKVSSGVGTAIQSSILALDGIHVEETEGIVEKDVEKTIENLGKIGSLGMNETDKLMLEIMICK